MGKICIKVEEYRKELLVNWFRDIHTNSKIDFWEETEGICLWNGENELLVKLNQDEIEEFKKGLYSNEDVWRKNYQRYMDIDLFDVVWRKEKYLDFYFSLTPDKMIETSGVWNIGNISIDKTTNGEDVIEIEISESVIDSNLMKYQNWKNEWERKLADKYCTLYKNWKVELPLYYNGIYDTEHVKKLLFYMLFYLKGACLFEEVEELDMLKEYINKIKYSNIFNTKSGVYLQPKGEIQYPLVPEDIVTEFAPEITVGILMKLMGVYRYAQAEKDFPQIAICKDNIKLVVRNMLYKDGFKDKFVTPLEIKMDFEEENSIREIDFILEKIVVAHEFGHHVFRNLYDNLSINERETLANWFASIILEDSYSYRLSLFLNQYQTAEYQDFIKIPTLFNLKKETYKDYCDKIYGLVGGLW